MKISYLKAQAIRILIADELGLNPEYVAFAKLAIDDKLYVMQFARLESAGHDAVKKIHVAGKVNEAIKLQRKYLGAD